MVLRDGNLVEAKPADITDTDLVITLRFENEPRMDDVVSAVSSLIVNSTGSEVAAYREVQTLLDQNVKIRVKATTDVVKSVKLLRKADNEYVYDIGMRNESQPWFFGNNILLHNSVYFSAYPMFKDEIARGELSWTKDDVIKLYDSMVPMINESFPVFLKERFNVPERRSDGVS